ncbi:MAG: protein kinase [Catenulispora sp.]|nr:protein kinase [Catenulispora sp.]
MEALRDSDPVRVGPYELEARLGGGGMGLVFLARSPAGRQLAVKVIHPEMAADPQFADRFRREVAAARAVSGFYTAPVVDAAPDADPPWLATAYVTGPTLEKAVAEGGPLPARGVRRLAAGLAEALTSIHSAGVIHRDVKPTNVLLADDGPRLIDFGISRAADDLSLTHTGTVIGSAGFMSPEQAEGGTIGTASDVFSLGAVLAFAATGAGPFGSGPAPGVMYRVVHSEPDLNRVPGEIRSLIAACLAKDPARRPTPAQVLALATGAPDGPPYSPSTKPVEGGTPAGRSTNAGAAPTLAATMTADLAVSGKSSSAARDTRQDHEPPSTWRLSSATPRTRRGFLAVAGAAAVATAGGLAWAVEGHHNAGTTLRAGSQPLQVGLVKGQLTSLAFQAGGHALATCTTQNGVGAVLLWNVTSSSQAVLAGNILGTKSTSLAFSPAGHTIAVGNSDGTLHLWNVADIRAPAPLGQAATSADNLMLGLAFSPDGRTLAGAGTDNTVRLWNVADPASPTTVGPPLTGPKIGPNASVAFSPDGRTLACASYDMAIRLWNVTDPANPAALGQPITGHTDAVTAVAFSPDGHTLASASGDKTIRLWNVTDPTAPTVRGQPLTGHTAMVWSVAFSPDGRSLVSGGGDKTVRLWDVTDPTAPTVHGQPGTDTSDVLSVAFSPDGHTVASGNYDGAGRLWSISQA